MKSLVVPAYTVGIAIAEALGVFTNVLPSIVCHAILLVMLLMHDGLTVEAPYRRMLPVLALTSLLRILSVAMPIQEMPRIFWYALIGVPLLVATAIAARHLGLAWKDLGLQPAAWPVQIVIACSGVPLGIIAFLLLQPTPLVAVFNWQNAAIGSAVVLIFAAFTEELLFRGLLMHVAGEVYGRAGLMYSTVVFAIMYIGSLSVQYLLFIALVGLFFGWCVQLTGTIWGVVLAHGLINIGTALVWPFVDPHLALLVLPGAIPMILLYCSEKGLSYPVLPNR
jgi:membrane protease YdiL (CAAX protease family)